jgi:hypothetical protein
VSAPDCCCGACYHPVIDPGRAVGRVQDYIPQRLPGQRPVLERSHLGVQVSADPADLRFGDPAVGAERFDQVVDLAGWRCRAGRPP